MPPPTLGGRAAAEAKPGTPADLQAQLNAALREVRHLREQRDILKKNIGHFVRSITERYEWIHTMKADHSILALCQNLEVSVSGYYDWQRRRTVPGPRALANQTLTKAIQAIHARSRQTYGSPRILAELRKQGHGYGRNRVARIMRETSLCGRQKGRYRVRTTDSNHERADRTPPPGRRAPTHRPQSNLGG